MSWELSEKIREEAMSDTQKATPKQTTTSTFDLWWPDQSFQPPKNYKELAAIAVRFANDTHKASHDKLLEALKGLSGLFREDSKFYISKLGAPITNADQEKIDRAFMAAEAAIQSAEEQPKISA